jgi:radical SAM protein with 4Fe4S-binding SPASM domain
MVFTNIVLHIQEYNIDKHPYSWDNIGDLHNMVVNAVTNIKTPFELTVDDVGHKGSTNCPAGENEISIDSDGNIYGCYVFINQNSESTILGNILTGEMNEFHVEHYKKLFEYSLTTDKKCSSCDISNYCHRCPAGKYLTDGSLYGSTDACQDIVRMALKINSMLMIKTFILTYGGMIMKPVGNEMTKLVEKWIGRNGDLSDIYDWEKLLKNNLSLKDLFDKIVVKYSLYQIRNINIPSGKEELFIIAILMFIIDYYDLPILGKS